MNIIFKSQVLVYVEFSVNIPDSFDKAFIIVPNLKMRKSVFKSAAQGNTDSKWQRQGPPQTCGLHR